MNAQAYAQAIQQALGESDSPSRKVRLSHVREALRRRGHEKLLPAIFREYQKLELKKERSAAHRRTTPEKERTRILLELYRKLVNTR